MTERTAIEWTDSTWNPWIGCTKISPGCDHCYAERDMAIRRKRVTWGAGAARSRTSEAYWKQPLRWNRHAPRFIECSTSVVGGCGFRGEARFAGICPHCQHGHAVRKARRRVFCASLADVFDNEAPIEWLADLLDLIRRTPNLDWLLLTKRIGNRRSRILAARDHAHTAGNRDLVHWLQCWLDGKPPHNVWLGATIVNQEEADRDIPKLLETTARVRFLSCEPLLGPIDLAQACARHRWIDPDGVECCSVPRHIDWLIAGGESGPHARPMHPDWVRSLRDQCATANVPFLFKQWGEYVSVSEVAGKGAHHRFDDGTTVRRVGKKLAGRMLDGREHTEFPA
jgi:protein gp37